MRRTMVQHLWGQLGLPNNSVPLSIDYQVQDPDYADLVNLASIDALVCEMEFGLHSVVYHFHPTEAKNRLLIYHQGHRGDFIHGKHTIGYFVERGYAVMAFAMPLLGPNAAEPVTLPSGETISLEVHGDFATLEEEGISTLKFFFEPLAVAINYAQEVFAYSTIDMIGFSGGGWTTSLYAGIDPRIRRSYPVAGTLPFPLRTEGPDVGDYEQLRERRIYSIASYLDFYVLGALEAGRRQLQVLNNYDSCCFAAAGREDSIEGYAQAVAEVLQEIGGGEFAVFIDSSHDGHIVSDQVLSLVAQDLER